MLKYYSDQCSDDDNALCKFTCPKNLIPYHLLMHLKCLFCSSHSHYSPFSEKIMGLDFLVPLLPLIQLFIFMIFVLCQWPCML